MRATKRSSGPTRRGNERAASARPAQDGGRVLERLALEQAGQEQVALLPEGQLLVEVDVVAARQQPPGLELDQRGRDEQELGGHVEVEGLRAARARPGRRRRSRASETSYRSTCSRRIRCSSRSKGPSKTGVTGRHRRGYRTTSDADRAHAPSPAWRRLTPRRSAPAGLAGPRRPGRADSLAGHDTRALGHPAHRRRPPRQLPGRAAELGHRPAHARRLLLRRRPARPHRPPGPRRAARPQTLELAATLLAVGPRPRRLHALRAEPRARAHPAGLDHGVHGVASASCSA